MADFTQLTPVSNWGLIAEVAISRGIVTLGEFLVYLALACLCPTAADMQVIREVYERYAAEHATTYKM